MSQWVCSVCSLALCCSCPRSHYLPSPTLFSVTQKNYPPAPLRWLASAPFHKHIHIYFTFELRHFQSASRRHTVPRAVSARAPLITLGRVPPSALPVSESVLMLLH